MFTVKQFGKRLDGKIGLTGEIANLSTPEVQSQIVNARKRGERIEITITETGSEVPAWHFAPTFTGLAGITYRGTGELIYAARQADFPDDIDAKLDEFGYSHVSSWYGIRQYSPK